MHDARRAREVVWSRDPGLTLGSERGMRMETSPRKTGTETHSNDSLTKDPRMAHRMHLGAVVVRRVPEHPKHDKVPSACKTSQRDDQRWERQGLGRVQSLERFESEHETESDQNDACEIISQGFGGVAKSIIYQSSPLIRLATNATREKPYVKPDSSLSPSRCSRPICYSTTIGS